MKDEYWQILLKKWRDQGNDGLTIPYVIGSQGYLPSEHDKQNIRELIESIVTNETTVIYIKYCLYIKAIIIGIFDESKGHIPGSFPNYKNNPQDKFFLTNFLSDLGTDIDSIIESLIEGFQVHINNEEFSINNQEWGPFEPSEEKFISDTYASLQN
jgi:hypothetical protein